MNDAEQLLNDVFLKIFTSIKKYKHKGSFEGWMKRILINTCLDNLRTKHFMSSIKMQIISIPIDDISALDADIIQRMEFNELVSLIQSLPDVTRTVFNLSVFEGYTHKDIAKLLDITENTSLWHAYNARKLLKKMLKKTNQINNIV